MEQKTDQKPCFTAKITDTEITFLKKCMRGRIRFKKASILDKPTETFQCTRFTTCNPTGIRKGFIKGRQALRLLKKNSSKANFEENVTKNTI